MGTEEPSPTLLNTAGDDQKQRLHMCFFPYIAAGHLFPMLAMARLFAVRGARVAIVATPSTAAAISAAVSQCSDVYVIVLTLPPESVTGLPDGWDSPSAIVDLNFFALQNALALLRDDLVRRLRATAVMDRPDCLVSDMFLPWTTDVAFELKIPRIVFHGMSFFALCLLEHLHSHRPQDTVVNDDDLFIIPGLPMRLCMTRAQIPDPLKTHTCFNDLMERMRDADARSYGVLVNSFYELEPDFADHFRSAFRRRAWSVGPVFTNSKPTSSADKDCDCLPWLDKQRQGTVLYVCFGSLSKLSSEQLNEIALSLDELRRPFIWVVPTDAPDDFVWLVKKSQPVDKGLIIRGWAPQKMILGHEAVGGFITHCGWNSVLESVVAGKPMVTWPLCADQSFNEQLVVDVLGVGVAVGAKVGAAEGGVVVGREKVVMAVERVMGAGEDAEKMRTSARRLSELAAAAVGEGGSSHGEIGRLMDDLVSLACMAKSKD